MFKDLANSLTDPKIAIACFLVMSICKHPYGWMSSALPAKQCKITYMETIGDRIKKKRLELKLTQTALAKVIGVERAAVSQWENGQTKDLKAENLINVSDALGVSPKWLVTGQGLMRDSDVAEQPAGHMDADLQPGPELPEHFRRIPVMGTAQLGPDGYWTETGYPVGIGEGYVEFFSRDPGAYALRVQGDSMSPTIRSGWFVIVEPNSEHLPGSYVVICTKNERCMVKEFLFERNGDFAFASVNDSYGRMTLRQDEIEKIHSVSAIITPQKFKPW
jgi:phage repressor protein C with HTH and peptisase S24 domain